MRIFNNMTEAVNEVERDLFEMGMSAHSNSFQNKIVATNPEYETKELIGYSFMLNNWEDANEVITDRIGYDAVIYCEKELLDRVKGDNVNPGDAFKVREDVWKPFLNEDGKFDYTYSERLYLQRELVINELYMNHDSRQGIFTIYDKHDDVRNLGGKKRIPCSMYYHLMRRKINGADQMLMIYTMRSCDFYTHFPIDIWLACNMLDYYCAQLKTQAYGIIYFCDSLHAYKKDWDKRRIF